MRGLLWVVVTATLAGLVCSQRRCSTTAPSCCETDRNCVFWSQNQECQRNPSWMLVNCKVSCNVCGGPATAAPVTSAPTPVPRDPAAPEGCPMVHTSEVLFAPTMSEGQFRSSFLQGCGRTTVSRDCSRNLCFHKKYRSMDGMCNNLEQPLKGAAFTPLPRLLPNDYDDGVNAVTDSLRGLRPNPRVVSSRLLAMDQSIPLNVSSILMQFGQLVSHDITKNGLLHVCASCTNAQPNCASIPQRPFDGSPVGCFPYTRSVHQCGTGFAGRPREQLNSNTAFIDASGLYSSDSTTVRGIRFGTMLRTKNFNNRAHAPDILGDNRNFLITGLGALHTMFIRLHNRVATTLMQMNPRWNQDRVFEETRKIVGAIMQVIVYNEYLPALLGPVAIRKIPNYSGYQKHVDPSILNEFAGAAYRLHGLIQASYPLMDPNYRPFHQYDFRQGVLGPGNQQHVHSDIDSVLRGLIGTPAKAAQRLTSIVAERLGESFALAILSLQRGRDQGLRPYNDYRRHCGLSTITSFDSWPEVQDPTVVARVKELYRNGPDTMDLYVGGLLEKPQGDAVMGPTFTCIIAEQFKRIRDGDRFYFENSGIFTSQQVIALRRVTLSWVICSNSDSMQRITPNVFFHDNGRNAIPCSSLQSLDLSPWRS